MKILNASQLRELDAYTIEHEPITSLELMERAATAVTEALCRRWYTTNPFVIMAGAGNNGGDALAVARLLAERGYIVEAFLFNTNGKLSPECEENRRRLKAIESVRLTEVNAQFEPPLLTEETIVIDGLFGTGINKALTGGFAALVKFLNASPATIVSIDMPSGLMCEDNTYNVHSHIVRAQLTLTFQCPKLAQILPDTQEYVGELEVLDIGLDAEALCTTETEFQIIEKDEVVPLLKKRNPYGHKGTFGSALLVAGQAGEQSMAGTAVLAAKACLRSGVGKVTLRTPSGNRSVLHTCLPEAILSIDPHETYFSQAIEADNFTAVGIGPGIGTRHETAVAFIEQVRHSRKPLLIDADGINILSQHKAWMKQIPADTILTPHPQEFRRLGTQSIDPYSTLMEAKELAKKQELYIVLKGHYTAICTPAGKVFFNPTGNHGMATAGSGDVLTGIITALLAQQYRPLDACLLGVYLHGLAGDIAATETCTESLIASDIIQALPKAFCHLRDLQEIHS